MDVKLVIWDLDDTFWKGTLSEGKIQPVQKNLELVAKLTDRGIMNSIASKNDYEKAMSVLRDQGVAQYFIFPHISWDSKGETVKEILQMAKLRAENTWFIDDNISNREEVKYYNAGIRVVHPDYLAKNDILMMNDFQGKDDVGHSRLKQYQILEKRIQKKKSFSSNEEFLRSSNITVSIHENPLCEISRIFELVQRTNQMNYTKNRMNQEELIKLLSDKSTQSAYIKARDNFGYYGIVGFYALHNESLVHFLFSCRTLGFGIENYIYQKLQCPKIKVSGNVAFELNKDKIIDWIDETDDAELPGNKGNAKRSCLLMIGGCDLKLACRYLENTFKVREEFNTVVLGREIRTSDTTQLLNAIELDWRTQHQLCKELPFFDESVTFQTKIFSGRYQIVILSVVDDYIRGIYQNKSDGYYIGFGAYWNQKKELSKFSEEELNYLRNKFVFIGKEPLNIFKENIRKIITLLPNNTRIMLINGAELQNVVSNMKELNLRNHEMNTALDEVLCEFPEVMLIDMRKIVKNNSDLLNDELRHFTNKVYYQIASEIVEKCEEENISVQLKSFSSVTVKDFAERIKNGINRRISMVFR